MRSEPGTVRGAETPEEAAGKAVDAADLEVDSSESDFARNVYAYDTKDDLVAIVQVENNQAVEGWVAVGLEQCVD